MRGARWVFAIASLGVAAAVLIPRLRRPPPLDVEVVQLERGVVREMVPAASTGEVKPARRVNVRSDLAGTVKKLHKRRGDRVTEREVLLTFESDELLARTDQARANVESAKIAEAIAKTRAEAAGRALDRARSLESGGALAAADLERAQTEASAASHAIEQAAAAHRQAEAALKLTTVALQRVEIHAPFAGVLQEVAVEVGVLVTPGTFLFDLIDDSTTLLEIPFDESDAPKIAVGQRVSLSLEGLRAKELWGTVSYVPPAMGKAEASTLEVTRVKKDRSLYVEVKPDDPAPFRVGASVNAELLLNEKSDVAFLPSNVLIGRGIEREVYLAADGRAKRVKIRPGLTSWERTEIISGLTPSDVVISSLDVDGLEDGASVKVKGEPKKSPLAESR
ncbi:MAG: efflux RND transporter periplasmic adaptor subunit [Deltaproteobacteria bacterium]|nr:efflux RND transporter periplasmic adaptor subunit [Deltaproteobacteria bacterium]